MIIKALRVQNYRCVKDATLFCDDLIALVGANGAGKSSFLQALATFYDPDARLEQEDYCGHETDGDVIITVTFASLEPQATTRFNKYIRNGELSVARVFHWDGTASTSKYHGSKAQLAAFGAIRQAGSAGDAKAEYEGVRAQEAFQGLPKWKSRSEALDALDQWEAAHPEACVVERDEGQFFGFKSVATGYLGQFTRFILVPAVRDASLDGEEGKESLFTQLITLVVRSDKSGDEELQALNAEVTDKYKTIIKEKKEGGLKQLQKDLAGALAVYVRDSDIQLSWAGIPNIQLPAPKAVAKVGEEGHLSAIERKGHGLQRAFIMTLLQFLERARSTELDTEQGDALKQSPDLIIGIEEPELYQHPDRQRHIASVLASLAKISVEAGSSSTQVFYTTHSPQFVGLDRFDKIRVARKHAIEDSPLLTTRLASATLSAIAAKLAAATQKAPEGFTAESLRIRLQPLMTPWMNEGFFSEIVVLVEGEQDRAALLASAELVGENLERIGISVIPCIGKANIDRPAIIFREMGIATYVLFDGDVAKPSENSKTLNRLLSRIVGEPEVDFPSYIKPSAACFADKLETTLEDELGSGDYAAIIAELQAEFEVRKDDVLKNPLMMAALLRRAKDRGRRSKTLDSITAAILEMRSRMKPVAAAN